MTPDDAAARADLGTPAARKSGRNPRWPYVPIVLHGERQEQILRRAYATRAEAVDAARRTIEHRRRDLARKLAQPNYRALRAQHNVT